VPSQRDYLLTTNADDTVASYSNFGTPIFLLAPAYDVLSTWPNNSYAKLSGTSVSSALAAGAVALYLSRNPTPRWTTSAKP